MADKGEVIIQKGKVNPQQMEEIEAGDFVTVGEIADRLRYSYQWVLWMLQEGRIKGIKPLGGRWRIPRSEFDKLLKQGLPPMPREQAEKPPMLDLVVDEKDVKEPERKEKRPTSWFPFDFSPLWGEKK